MDKGGSEFPWIIKEMGTHGGTGIEFLTPGEPLEKIVSEREKRLRYGNSFPDYIIQQLVHPTFLLNNKKNTFRMGVSVTSTFPLVAHVQHQYTNAAAAEWKGDWTDHCSWVSNGNQRRKCAKDDSGRRSTSFQDLCTAIELYQEEAESPRLDFDGNAVTCLTVLDRAAAILRSVLLAGQESFKLEEGCFLYMGVDFVLDADLQPWLLEFNRDGILVRHTYGI